MPCFLCFTKSRAKKHAERAVPAGHRRRRKKVAARRRKKPRSGKGFNWASANLLFRCVDSRFAEPRIFFWKGFNFVSEKLLFGCTDSRFAEPRCSLQRERIVTFCIVQKVTKKHTGLRPATCDSNLRSIRDFDGNDRRSSSNRPRRVLRTFRISPVRI